MGFIRNKLNLWLFISFLVAALLTIWIYVNLNEQVGDISYNAKLYTSTFNPCDEDRIFQYYTINTTYEGVKKAIKRKLLSKINPEKLPKNGLLTVRFVVNCRGEAGYFRAKMIDSELNDIELPTEAVYDLFNLVSALEDWVPGMVQGETRDTYVQISFKLEQGNVIDIF